MFKKSFAANLAAAIVLIFVLGLVFFTSLSWLTRHGHELAVPKVEGMNLPQAMDKLEKMGFDIQVDSAWIEGEPPLKVIKQQPYDGFKVKYGRTIFLTVNKKSPPMVPMPNLVNLSFRSALMIISSNRLAFGDTIYRSDIAAGAVLEQLVNGQKVTPGTLIPIGSRIDLVVGSGLGNEVIPVPQLIGLSYADAMSMLNNYGLTATALWDGDVLDSASAIIYDQTPKIMNEVGQVNYVRSGEMIDLRIMQEPSDSLIESNKKVQIISNRPDEGMPDEEDMPAQPAPPRRDTAKRQVTPPPPAGAQKAKAVYGPPPPSDPKGGKK
jgi:beta-lactam-binding protein with PASTA domain